MAVILAIGEFLIRTDDSNILTEIRYMLPRLKRGTRVAVWVYAAGSEQVWEYTVKGGGR